MTKELITQIFRECQSLNEYDNKTHELSNQLFNHIANGSYNPIYDKFRVEDYLRGVKFAYSELAQEIDDYYFDGVIGYGDGDRTFEFHDNTENRDEIFLDSLIYRFLKK